MFFQSDVIYHDISTYACILHVQMLFTYTHRLFTYTDTYIYTK